MTCIEKKEITARIIFFMLFAVCGYIFIPASVYARGASMYLSPSSGSFHLGSTVDISIVLNTGGNQVNTVEAEIKFPEDKLQITNPSLGKSIIQIWAANPTFSNKDGRAYFVGGIPSPGIKTSEGVVTTLTFRVIGTGKGNITFGGRTRVFADDGSGENILDQTTPGSYSFSLPPPEGPQVFSPTHPDQTKWYNNPNPTISWIKDEAVDDFSYSIDRNPKGFPDSKGKGSDTSVSFENLEDGILYFHIRAKQGGVWGGITHFILNIDTKPPAFFNSEVSPSERTNVKNPILNFFTTDSLSGLNHYEAKIVPLDEDKGGGSSFFFEVQSPYQMAPLDPGKYKVVIRAFDNASNSKDSDVDIKILSSRFKIISSDGIDLYIIFIPWNMFVLFLIIIIILILITWAIIWWFHHPHVTHEIKKDLGKTDNFNVPGFPDENYSDTKNIIGSSSALIIIAVACVTLILSFSFASSQALVKPPLVTSFPSSYHPLDEFLYLRGEAPINSDIKLLFSHEDGKNTELMTRSDSNGIWELSERIFLSSGEWQMKAAIAKNNVVVSDWSSAVKISSIVPGIPLLGLVIKYSTISSFLILFIACTLGAFLYFMHYVRKVRKKMIDGTY